ncbi:succinate dehydrogenase, cytochrome b556 subunit [Thiohalophilus thiocyanatoxydans]|uniref:Succinate dehydrogenase cytochrome b556 subunit n=1 Tax=Thiohalophilus thiocyanatoxydans TaxID=381308 RepID=A0A4R8IYT3_9GAMM|nr:succinate dehydrogenase, cytochrome b556 subunit [Thiohalophilus thiocyanatoxydans]TDY02999.1 succinate dehydrogenase subunit C [Thiohalophilus thiocyanatoxydans]
MTTKNVRPKFLNLFRIHLPVTGVVSFAHRVSGAVLVLSLPVVVFLFALSLHSEQGFERVSEILQCGWVRLLSLLVLWALFSHLFSGVRFLLLDLDIGMRLAAARASAWLVLALAALVLIALLMGVLL